MVSWGVISALVLLLEAGPTGALCRWIFKCQGSVIGALVVRVQVLYRCDVYYVEAAQKKERLDGVERGKGCWM